MVSGKRVIARIAGNFGISFFSPLISGNLAEQVFEIGIDFQATLLIAGLSSFIVTGLALSKELRDWGRSTTVTTQSYTNATHLDSDDIELAYRE